MLSAVCFNSAKQQNGERAQCKYEFLIIRRIIRAEAKKAKLAKKFPLSN